MGTAKEHRAWVNSTDELTIEKFSIKFGYSEPRIENKSHASLFWLDQRRTVAIKKGKSIAEASLVTAATEELPEPIRSEASYGLVAMEMGARFSVLSWLLTLEYFSSCGLFVLLGKLERFIYCHKFHVRPLYCGCPDPRYADISGCLAISR